MSSSIHYKFRAIIESKTLSFEGLSILAADLKREICAKESIKAEAFDLKLTNAHTKREYAADEQIPRNSSIIVQRVPKEDGEKLPKIQGVNTGMVQRNDPSSSSSLSMATHIPQSIFNKMSEEERLKHIKDISSSAYDPSTYQKRPSGALTGLPPPTYTCNRCHQPGHWYKNCPQLNQKRTTGIPSQELMETTADDPHALLHPSGKYVIPIMHWRARQHKKNVEENPIQEKIIPKTLLCPQCGHLFKDAVITPCCGISFCADCISQRLLESEERHCPGCNKTQLALDSLVSNTNLRQFVANWEAGSNPAEMQVERVRIGLAPSSNSQIASTTSTATLSPSVNAEHPSAQPSVAVPTNPPGTPAIAIPTPAIQIPTSFTQPPPNMMMVPPSEILAPPGTISHISTLGSTHVPIMQPVLPPIPGVQPMTNMYNQPMEVHNGQFMEAWEAYLNRNDKHSRRERERDYRDRRRKRSRDRHRSRSVSEERKRSKRDRRDRSPRRDKDRERSRDRSKDRSRERYKKREYDSKDLHRSNRKKESTDENADKEEARKHEKYANADSSKEAIPKDDIDEEAAIDDALKEVETLNMLSKSAKLDDAEDDSSIMLQNSLLNDEDKKHEIKENAEENRNSSEPENLIESHAEKTPRNRSSDSDRSTQEKTDQEKSENEKSERDVEKQNKSDSDNEKNKKEKKSKKHKKEKKHKKDKDETEEERKERKRIKKEKKEKKKREKDKEIEKDRRDKHGERDRRGSDPDREHRKKVDKHKEKDKRDDKSKDTGKYKERSRYHDSRISRREKESSPKEKSASYKKSESESRHKSQRIAEYKDDGSKAAVIDEKQIRDHFSPPPVLLQNKKITLNI